jgi:hypothetical protein
VEPTTKSGRNKKKKMEDFAAQGVAKRLRMDPDSIKTRRGPWTVQEDELLSTLVKKYGTKKWAVIAELVPGRVGKQCRERWLNHLRTDVLKTAWTIDEDMTLIKAQQKLGNRWSAIARLLPGRPENSVKNRWNSLINKKKRGVDDPDSANVSVDDLSSGEYSSEVEDNTSARPRVKRLANRNSPGRMSEYSTDGEALSCTVLPVTTPSSGSPQNSSFKIASLPPVPWSGNPTPMVFYPCQQQPRLFHDVTRPAVQTMSQTKTPPSKEDSKGLMLLAALCM